MVELILNVSACSRVLCCVTLDENDKNRNKWVPRNLSKTVKKFRDEAVHRRTRLMMFMSPSDNDDDAGDDDDDDDEADMLVSMLTIKQ